MKSVRGMCARLMLLPEHLAVIGCAIAMIAQQLNDISNTEMGAERL